MIAKNLKELELITGREYEDVEEMLRGRIDEIYTKHRKLGHINKTGCACVERQQEIKSILGDAQ